MRVWSNDISNKGKIPVKFTADGPDINPHIAWDDIPEGTKSLALIVDDPDAPKGTWTHWLVGNIPPEPGQIEQGNKPKKGDQKKNDFGTKDYGGPSPPSGTHRYFFKLYALDTPKIRARKKDDFYHAVEEHKIDEAYFIGLYSRD